MQATVVSYQDGFVQFQVGFDRYRMAPELTDGIYNLQPDDSVIASIRMKRAKASSKASSSMESRWKISAMAPPWPRPARKRGPDLI